MEFTHLFAVPGERHTIDIAIIGDDKIARGAYSGETLEQITKRYPGAQLYSYADWTNEVSTLQRTPITWSPTTEEQYRDMLEVLPPAFWRGGLFLVGEPADHDVANGRPRFAAFWKRGDQYLACSRPLTVAEARTELGAISAHEGSAGHV